jgi:iron complex outermembrane receptor protein
MDVIASSPAGSQVNFRSVNQVFPFSQALINPGVPCTINPNSTATCAGGQLTTLATIQGTSPNLKPQNGKSWSIGGDFTPVEGLRASLTYYVTTYENAFANPSLNPAYSTLGLGIYNNSAGTAITQSMIDAFIAQGSVVIGQTGTSPPATPSNIYLLADIRTVNLKFSRVSGLDYSLRYDFSTGFGKMWAGINGTHNLSNTSIPYPGSPTVNNLIVSQGATAGSETGPLGRFTAQIGASSGGFRTQLTLTHLDGFQVLPTSTLFQSSVSSWDQFGLYASYEFSDESRILSGTQVSVTVNNLFNTAPPLVKSVANIAGSVNGHFGDTVGRVIQVGLRKRF